MATGKTDPLCTSSSERNRSWHPGAGHSPARLVLRVWRKTALPGARWPPDACSRKVSATSLCGAARAPGIVEKLPRSLVGAPCASMPEPASSRAWPSRSCRRYVILAQPRCAPSGHRFRCPRHRTYPTSGGTHVRADRSGCSPLRPARHSDGPVLVGGPRPATGQGAGGSPRGSLHTRGPKLHFATAQ
jgi:hypothetical protein